MRRPRLLHRPAIALAAALCLPAGLASAARAATVTVDPGTGPVPLTQGATDTVFGMAPEVDVAFPTTSGRFSLTFARPDGTGFVAATCLLNATTMRPLAYRGDGLYGITVTGYDERDAACATPLSTERYAVAVTPAVALMVPSGPVLTRAPNAATARPLALPLALVPGAGEYEVRYVANAQLASDGGLAGTSYEAVVDAEAADATLTFPAPGVYTVVARASVFSDGGRFSTPWSAPARIIARAPFDLRRLVFTDARGPSYRIQATLGEATIRGRVRLALAKGRKGGRYVSIGSARIDGRGRIAKRFTQPITGVYRLRITYGGARLAAPGQIVALIQIARRQTLDQG